MVASSQITSGQLRWAAVGKSLGKSFRLIGGGTLYHFATHHDRWYWWLLPTAAWHAFAAVVVRRKPQ